MRKKVEEVDGLWTIKEDVDGPKGGGVDLWELVRKKLESPLEKSEEPLKEFEEEKSYAGETKRGPRRNRCGIRAIFVDDRQEGEACV